MSIHRTRRTILGPRGRYTNPFGDDTANAISTAIDKGNAQSFMSSLKETFASVGASVSGAVSTITGSSQPDPVTAAVPDAVNDGTTSVGGKIGGFFDTWFGGPAVINAPSTGPMPMNKKLLIGGALAVGYLLLRKKK